MGITNLSNMVPYSPILDQGYQRRTNVVPFGYFTLHHSSRAKLSYFDNFCFCKFRQGMVLSTRNHISTLFNHVVGVVFGCAYKKMTWSDALLVITGMANKMAGFNLSIGDLIHNAGDCFSPATDSNGCSGSSMKSAAPFNTVIITGNVGQKPLNQRHGSMEIFTHMVPHVS